MTPSLLFGSSTTSMGMGDLTISLATLGTLMLVGLGKLLFSWGSCWCVSNYQVARWLYSAISGCIIKSTTFDFFCCLIKLRVASNAILPENKLMIPAHPTSGLEGSCWLMLLETPPYCPLQKFFVPSFKTFGGSHQAPVLHLFHLIIWHMV